MGQFLGVLGLILSETPVLPLNVTRYVPALKLAMNGLRPTNATVLGICGINIFTMKEKD
jgi:hypothetical protein